jgi:hypothetical protein
MFLFLFLNTSTILLYLDKTANIVPPPCPDNYKPGNGMDRFFLSSEPKLACFVGADNPPS